MRNAPAVVTLAVSMFAACSGGSTSQPQTIPSNQAPPTTTEHDPPAGPPGLPKEVCAQRASDYGAVPLREEQVALRRGSSAKTFADIRSTRADPIEVCMPEGERAWLGRITCTDGSAPSSTARSGSVGAGGTCGSIIDLYAVTCPEQQYEVFMDMYMCPPGEGM